MDANRWQDQPVCRKLPQVRKNMAIENEIADQLRHWNGEAMCMMRRRLQYLRLQELSSSKCSLERFARFYQATSGWLRAREKRAGMMKPEVGVLRSCRAVTTTNSLRKESLF
jgi:hypothetical protein